MQQQRRYEAVKRRQQQKDEAEVVEEGEISEDTVEKMSEDAMETDQPLSSDIVTADESLEDSFKSLEQDYQLRLEELQAAKCSAALGRGFPDETMLKGDDKMCSFYTGLPSYNVLVQVHHKETSREFSKQINQLPVLSINTDEATTEPFKLRLSFQILHS